MAPLPRFIRQYGTPHFVVAECGPGDVTLLAVLLRRVAAIFLVLALPESFLAAPFEHVHEHGLAKEHVAKNHAGILATHMHFGVHLGPNSGWSREADESARSLDLYRLDLTQPFEFSIALRIERTLVVVQLVQQEWLRDSDWRLHDPPRIGERSTRAPPV